MITDKDAVLEKAGDLATAAISNRPGAVADPRQAANMVRSGLKKRFGLLTLIAVVLAVVVMRSRSHSG